MAWAAVAMLLFYAAQSALTSSERLSLVALLALAIYLLTLLIPRLSTAPIEPWIELGDDVLLLPADRLGRRHARIEYGDITSFLIAERPPLRRIVLGVKGRVFMLAERDFADPDSVVLFIMELRTRIRELPDGEAKIALIDHNVQFHRRALANPTHVTHALLVLIAVAFGLEFASGALSSPFTLLRFGANSPTLVADGQYYRLITANLLHGGALHLYLNSVALFSLGMVVERLIGPARFFVIFVCSAVAGALVSTLLARAPFSVGSSTAVFGALGCLFAINVKYRGHLPIGFRQSTRWWIFILALNAALPLAIPQIDAGAHVGGFVTGALLMFAIARGLDATALLVRLPGRAIRVAAVGLGVLCTAAVGYGVYEAVVVDQEALLTTLVSSKSSRPDELNAFAWFTVIDEESPPALIALAIKGAQRAVDAEPDKPEYIDTLATAHYRAGDLDKAIDLERKALDSQKIPQIEGIFASQLARFELARLQRDGPGPLAKAIRIEIGDKSDTPRKVTVRLDRAFEAGVRVHGVAIRGTMPIGHVRVFLGPSQASTTVLTQPDGDLDRWVDGVRVETTHVEPIGSLERGHARLATNSFDHDIARLPNVEASE